MNRPPAPPNADWLPRLHIAGRLMWWMAGVVAYCFGVAVVLDQTQSAKWPDGVEWTAVNGLVLGLLLVFRNKEAYDRWWEARKHWGQLANEIRNLALKARAYAAVDDHQLAEFGALLIGFATKLSEYLQTIPAAEPLHSASDSGYTPPEATVQRIYDTLARWDRDNRLGNAAYLLDWHARGLIDSMGACMRIRNTPLPSSYRALLRHGIAFSLIAAPWSLLSELGYWGLPELAVGFYFLLGIEFTAEVIEHPFGPERDDLPLAAYCQAIRQSVEAALGK